MVGHVLGMAEFEASLAEQCRQFVKALRADGVFIDALTALQVAKHRADTPDLLAARFADVAPKAVRGRRRLPGFVRRRSMPVKQAVGGVLEQWTFGFLVDVILTRDTWMHRIDLSRALALEPVLTSDHDGLIVADVVREWAGRHGQPCRLILTGAAGGAWTFGSGGPEFEPRRGRVLPNGLRTRGRRGSARGAGAVLTVRVRAGRARGRSSRRRATASGSRALRPSTMRLCRTDAVEQPTGAMSRNSRHSVRWQTTSASCGRLDRARRRGRARGSAARRSPSRPGRRAARRRRSAAC